jgi:A/G-specific adenine glycosylase
MTIQQERKKRKSLLDKDMETFISDVITHYELYGRHDLVWRKKITPYSILISEVMLQQTQVARVVPKFLEWMKCYPSFIALSEASLKDVLIMWQGLGYQRRAKALLTIAQKVESLPKSHKELIELPGIGLYTASAICAFAYNSFAHPVLETNIRTVLINHFYHDSEAVSDTELYDMLFLLEKNRTVQGIGARVWYYALMDYGAFLKSKGVSHNKKSRHHRTQTVYKGSLRELRAKVLFAIAHKEMFPADTRVSVVLHQLEKEKFITKNKKGLYFIP